MQSIGKNMTAGSPLRLILALSLPLMVANAFQQLYTVADTAIVGSVLGLGALAALGANLLHLKPCIEVRNGKMAVCKKYRGSFEKCIRQYVKERLDGREDIAPELAFITHAAADANVVAAAKEEAAQYGSFETVEETQAGCTVSCHCGPNTLGILFVRK